jgi:hypothetical protein
MPCNSLFDDRGEGLKEDRQIDDRTIWPSLISIVIRVVVP